MVRLALDERPQAHHSVELVLLDQSLGRERKLRKCGERGKKMRIGEDVDKGQEMRYYFALVCNGRRQSRKAMEKRSAQAPS